MAHYRFLTNEDSLGAGGFGSAHPCHEVAEDGTVLNEHLAVKHIVQDDEDADEKYRRFRNGGKLGKRLRHPTVMPVLATGTRKRDGTPFIIMPRADGGNLEDWLAIRRSEEERVDVFRQVLEAIAFRPRTADPAPRHQG
jgi:serine/threonine protein kinase